MFLASRILFLYAETSLHAGMGSGLGAVDMPIQRERQTGYPVIQSTGIKGALRQYALGDDKDPMIQAVFGPDSDNGDLHAGSISVEDARILAFPVRSLSGVFVWITCADVLARFRRSTIHPSRMDGGEYPNLPELIRDIPKGEAWTSSEKILLDGNAIVLEEYDYGAQFNKSAESWANTLADFAMPDEKIYQEYYRQRMRDSLVIISNDDFRDFVQYSTEIVTRIRLDKATKTVAKGALFTQELLPADTIFYAVVNATRLRVPSEHQDLKTLQGQTPTGQAEHVLNWLTENLNSRIQIGGDETVGRGRVRLSWL